MTKKPEPIREEKGKTIKPETRILIKNPQLSFSLEEENISNRKEYLEQRKEYVNDCNHQSDLVDKYLLTISTGSFGLSFMFIEKIVQDTIQTSNILVYSWIMFASSVVCSLFSFICSKNAFKKAIKELDDNYENPNHKLDTSFEDLQTSTFNIFSFIFLVLGFITFILFAYYNIKGE